MDEPDPAQVAKWRNELKDPKLDVRSSAAIELAKLLEDDAAVMDVLRDALTTDDGSDAADALGPLMNKYPKYLSLLFDSLKHKEASVRQNAVRAYGKAHQSTKPVVAALIAVAQDKEEDVRKEVYSTLGELGTADRRVPTALLAAFKTEMSQDCQIAAVTTLLPLAVGDVDIHKELIEAARKGDANVRIAFCKAVEDDMPSLPDAWPVLIGYWNDPNPMVQKQAASSLGWIMRRNAAAQEMVLAAARTSQSAARLAALDTLAEVLVARADIIELLHQAMNDPDPKIQKGAMPILQKAFRVSPLYQPLIKDALHHTVPELRAWGITTLGMSPVNENPQMGTELVRALKDEAPVVREAAVQVGMSVYQQFPEIKAGLLPLIHDPSPTLRANILNWISRQEDQDPAFQAFYVEALADEEASIRQSAASILSGRGKPTPQTVAALQKVLQDKNEEVRRAAIMTMGVIGTHDPRTVTLLVEATHHPKLGSEAAMALVRLGATGPEVVTALLPMINAEPFPAIPFTPTNWPRWKNNLGVTVSYAEYLATIAPADPPLLAAFRNLLNAKESVIRPSLIAAYGKLEIRDATPILDILAVMSTTGVRRDIATSIVLMAERLAAHPQKVTDIHLLRLIQVLQETAPKLVPLSDTAVPGETLLNSPRPPTLEFRVRAAITLLEQEKKRRLGKK